MGMFCGFFCSLQPKLRAGPGATNQSAAQALRDRMRSSKRTSPIPEGEGADKKIKLADGSALAPAATLSAELVKAEEGVVEMSTLDGADVAAANAPSSEGGAAAPAVSSADGGAAGGVKAEAEGVGAADGPALDPAQDPTPADDDDKATVVRLPATGSAWDRVLSLPSISEIDPMAMSWHSAGIPLCCTDLHAYSTARASCGGQPTVLGRQLL